MNRKRTMTAGVVVLVVLIGIGVGTWFLFVDTPSITESDLNATTPDPTISTAPSQFSLVAEFTSRSLSGGAIQANWSTGVRYDADSRARLSWLRSTTSDYEESIVQYQRYSSNATLTVVRYHASDPEEFEYRVESVRGDLDPETETLIVTKPSHTYEYYRKGPRSEAEVVPNLIPQLYFVQTIPFEHDGTTTIRGHEVEKYVPRNGWVETIGSVDDSPDRYISNTSGVMYVSQETGHIIQADVSFTSKRTDIRAGKWVGDGGNRGHLTIAVREELDDEELRPEWANVSEFETG